MVLKSRIDPEKRREFDEKMSKPKLRSIDIVYAGERGVDKFMARKYGHEETGKKVFCRNRERKFKKISVRGFL